jgi:hypothetical protein
MNIDPTTLCRCGHPQSKHTDTYGCLAEITDGGDRYDVCMCPHFKRDSGHQPYPFVEIVERPRVHVREIMYWPTTTITAEDILAIAQIIRDGCIHPAASIRVDTAHTDMSRITRLSIVETDDQRQTRPAKTSEPTLSDALATGLRCDRPDEPPVMTTDARAALNRATEIIANNVGPVAGIAESEQAARELLRSGILSQYRDNPMGYSGEEHS